MQANTRERGKKYEEIASGFLERRGYKIVKRNFYFGRVGEVDIIAYDNQTLVFVEVKARKSTEYGDPVHSITNKKRASWRKAAEGYIYVNKIRDVECRFDLILIEDTGNSVRIKHMINAM